MREPILWKTRRATLDLTERGVVMGILNATPDSFSDGGKFADVESACAHALEMIAGGAEIIDVGGESTRPGADPVDEAEECARVLPVIRAIRARSDALLSVDTQKAGVARAALDAGADIVNDVSALRADGAMAGVVAASGAGVVLMHMRGTPKTMQDQTVYADLFGEVREFLRQRLAAAVACGIDPMAIALDPGIGFGKTPEQNLALLAEAGTFACGARPVVIGASRKSFFAKTAGAEAVASRFWPGVATTCLCRELGARVFRVHDPAPHAQALRMTEAILAAE